MPIFEKASGSLHGRFCSRLPARLEGETVEEEADGLYAVCIQHEIDHLNGVLFIDHLSRLRRDRAMTKVKKVMRERVAA